MRILILSFALLLSYTSSAETKVEFPSDGNGVLDYCGEVVSELDSALSPASQERVLKFGWCVGYLVATEDRIETWRISGALQVMVNQKEGKPAPSHMLG